jgi:hypothetical protein
VACAAVGVSSHHLARGLTQRGEGDDMRFHHNRKSGSPRQRGGRCQTEWVAWRSDGCSGDGKGDVRKPRTRAGRLKHRIKPGNIAVGRLRFKLERRSIAHHPFAWVVEQIWGIAANKATRCYWLARTEVAKRNDAVERFVMMCVFLPPTSTAGG